MTNIFFLFVFPPFPNVQINKAIFFISIFFTKQCHAQNIHFWTREYNISWQDNIMPKILISSLQWLPICCIKRVHCTNQKRKEKGGELTAKQETKVVFSHSCKNNFVAYLPSIVCTSFPVNTPLGSIAGLGCWLGL